MIQIQNLYFYFEINGIKINNISMFNFFVVTQKAFGTIPYFELSIKTTNIDFIHKLKAYDKIKLFLGYSPDNLSKHQLILVNYTIQAIGNQEFTIRISGLTDLWDLMHKTYQRAEKTTLSEFLKQIKFARPDIRTESQDYQVWIQYCTEKQFIDESIPYMKTLSSPIYGFTLSNSLVVDDVKNALKQTRAIFSLADEKSLKIDQYQIESDNANAFFFSDGKQLPVIDILHQGYVFYNTKGKSSLVVDTDNKNFSPIINCGNCYEDYYATFSKNISTWIDIQRLNIITKHNYYISDEICNICDGVFIKNENNDNLSLNGNYIILQKDLNITNKNVQTTLRLARDYLL